jgi:hypothetical protein
MATWHFYESDNSFSISKTIVNRKFSDAMEYLTSTIIRVVRSSGVVILFVLLPLLMHVAIEKERETRVGGPFSVHVYSSNHEKFGCFLDKVDLSLQRQLAEEEKRSSGRGLISYDFNTHVFIDNVLKFILYDDAEKVEGRKYNFPLTEDGCGIQYMKHLRRIKREPILTKNLCLLHEAIDCSFSNNPVPVEYFIVYCKQSFFYYEGQESLYEETACINLARRVQGWLVGKQRGMFVFLDDDVLISDFCKIFEVFNAYDIKDFSFSSMESECKREIEKGHNIIPYLSDR